MKRSLSQAQLRAIRNQTRGRLTGLNVALRELRRSGPKSRTTATATSKT
jgi:hypothetical protein